jgi:hypothetical protein
MLVHDVGGYRGEVVNSERCEGMCWNTAFVVGIVK